MWILGGALRYNFSLLYLLLYVKICDFQVINNEQSANQHPQQYSRHQNHPDHHRNLHKYFTSSEKNFLLGINDLADNILPEYSVTHPRISKRRSKRNVIENHGIDEEHVTFEASALGQLFSLELKPSLQLLDSDFKVIERWSNRTIVLPKSAIDEDEENHANNCYYHGENAAISTCGGGFRGIIKTESSHFFTIYPLPKRFQTSNASHIIVRRELPENIQKPKENFCSHQLDYNENNEEQNEDEANPETMKETVYLWKHRRRKSSDNQTLLEPHQKRDIFINNVVSNVVDKLKKSFYDSVAPNVPASFLFEDSEIMLRKKRSIKTITVTTTPSTTLLTQVMPLGAPVHVETAVFVDRDLFQHMEANYPENTERELIRFVLAMINAVQLLYHDPSLGRPVNFMVKRLEILHEEPAGLHRPHDIDRFLSSFCSWQQQLNPPKDSDPAHWDHALILTGLDLYVVSKHGKISSQVVGLAPVAGMCTTTSSCTVNEGRHFESVYVVAHEIGHNLGMRHDGPHSENDCDPSSFIMSPTLGSGKITWSPCSRKYLQKFLETTQSRCLLDHGSSAGPLDHTAEGVLPGERFDANQQCMLKYGRGSKHSIQQPLDDICRDLHCQRDRYTWTSHPALEGTTCGSNLWCRSGRCIGKTNAKLRTSFTNNGVVVNGGWSSWETVSDCASGCLYGEEGRLRAGSTGIIMAIRECTNPRPENGGIECEGPDKRYQACNAMQCLNVPRMTISEFADQICSRARDVDSDLTGTGLQRISSDAEEACMVWCHKRGGGSKTRGWTFPDGTTCQISRQRRFGKPTYCISGRCEEFICDYNKKGIFINLPELCTDGNSIQTKWKNNPRRRESGLQWGSASGCHSHCMSPGSGIRLVVTKGKTPKHSIQLCQPDKLSCGRTKTPLQYATSICTKYKERVRRLSGLGMQISPALEDPDRPCRVACQDEHVSRRFYLVNGEEGWFPFGTDCSRGVSNKKAYCISGKCLDFGPDDTPLSETEFTLPLLSRPKRNIQRNKTIIKATLHQHDLDKIIAQLNLTLKDYIHTDDLLMGGSGSKQFSDFEIDLNNPIHVTMDSDVIWEDRESDNRDRDDAARFYYRSYFNEIFGG